MHHVDQATGSYLINKIIERPRTCYHVQVTLLSSSSQQGAGGQGEEAQGEQGHCILKEPLNDLTQRVLSHSCAPGA
jgi:hypothetical protein